MNLPPSLSESGFIRLEQSMSQHVIMCKSMILRKLEFYDGLTRRYASFGIWIAFKQIQLRKGE